MKEFDYAEVLKDHVLDSRCYQTDTDGSVIETFTIKKPGTRIYRIDYIIRDNILFVSGDCGEAIYQWSSDINLEFLAICGLDYFKGKCRASEVGQDFRQWDPTIVGDRFSEIMDDEEEKIRSLAKEDWEMDGKFHCFHPEEWALWVDSFVEAHRLGWDGETIGMAATLGYVPHCRLQLHWHGLKKAYELHKKGQEIAKPRTDSL